MDMGNVVHSCDWIEQGHVVAEEQLQIPASWLEDLEKPDAMVFQPSSSGQLEAEDKKDKICIVNRATELLVEVRPSFLETRLCFLPRLQTCITGLVFPA